MIDGEQQQKPKHGPTRAVRNRRSVKSTIVKFHAITPMSLNCIQKNPTINLTFMRHGGTKANPPHMSVNEYQLYSIRAFNTDTKSR